MQSFMFAVLSVEREPWKLADLPAGLESWVYDIGGWAALALFVVALAWLIEGSRSLPGAEPRWLKPFKFLTLLSFIGFVLLLLAYLPLAGIWYRSLTANKDTPALTTIPKPLLSDNLLRWLHLLAAGSALLAVLVPILGDNAFRFRFRRIWAIARLSFKEAVRGKILWLFLSLLLLVLFGSWFNTAKPEDQLREYVNTIFWWQLYLLVATLTLVVSLSIPNDVKNQTIYTIVTKPVERFEIVAGRFLGYAGLSTVIMLLTTGLGLLYIQRDLPPAAVLESQRAREPIYGDLRFFENGIEKPFKEGVNAGREWDYRRYITGKPLNAPVSQYAVWYFNQAPTLANRAEIPLEYAFDIYRMSKGESVQCTFTWRASHVRDRNLVALKNNLEEALRRETQSVSDEKLREFMQRVLEQVHGFKVLGTQQIIDYHTFDLKIPAHCFQPFTQLQQELKTLAANAPPEYQKLLSERGSAQQLEEAEAKLQDKDQRKAAFAFKYLPAADRLVEHTNIKLNPEARLGHEIWVNCNTPSQLVGMAKHDLYFLNAEGSYRINFFRGAFGCWLIVLIGIGVSLTLSTYMSAIISWLCTIFLLLLSSARDFIASVASGQSEGGGPFESLYRVVNKQNMVQDLEDTATVKAFTGTDILFRWIMRRVLNLLPDIERLWLVDYVAEGFSIPLDLLLLTGLFVAGYLFPWVILAYYLIKWREVASA